MLRLIASDLDGTLLQHGAQELNPDVFPLIQALKEKGCLFVSASGRQHANMRRLFAPVADDISYICENGALVVCNGKIISTIFMEQPLAFDIMKAILEQPDCEVMVSTPDMIYIQPKHDSFVYHVTNIVKNDVTVVDDIFSVKSPAIKISAYHPKGTAAMESYFHSQFGKQAAVVSSVDCWLDTMHLETNKGNAMQTLTSHLSIESSQIMAIGDNYNDMEMLAFAGHPIVMNNAQPELLVKYPHHISLVEPFLKELLDKWK